MSGLSSGPVGDFFKLDGRSAWLLEFNGHMLARAAIFAVMGLAGSTLNNAVAWSCLPYTVFVLQGILQGRPAKLGVNAAGQYLLLAINTFMSALLPGPSPPLPKP